MNDLIVRRGAEEVVNEICGICIQRILDIPAVEAVPVTHGTGRMDKREKIITELTALDDAIQRRVDDADDAYGLVVINLKYWQTIKDAIALLKEQGLTTNCKECMHYDPWDGSSLNDVLTGFGKCRNSLSPLYCIWCSETNGCKFGERR